MQGNCTEFRQAAHSEIQQEIGRGSDIFRGDQTFSGAAIISRVVAAPLRFLAVSVDAWQELVGGAAVWCAIGAGVGGTRVGSEVWRAPTLALPSPPPLLISTQRACIVKCLHVYYSFCPGIRFFFPAICSKLSLFLSKHYIGICESRR